MYCCSHWMVVKSAFWSLLINKFMVEARKVRCNYAIGSNNIHVFLHYTLNIWTHFNKYLNWTVATEWIFCCKHFGVTSVCLLKMHKWAPRLLLTFIKDLSEINLSGKSRSCAALQVYTLFAYLLSPCIIFYRYGGQHIWSYIYQ